MLKLFRILLLFTACCFGLYVIYIEEAAYSYTAENSSDVIIDSFVSQSLSRFYGFEVRQNVSLILPKSKNNSDFPLVIHIPGFGGNHYEAYKYVDRIRQIENKYPELNFAHIFLDPNIKNDHHGFVDSEINGPREQAFLKELLPELQKKYHISRNPKELFLTGHSSGGWSVVWLLLKNPLLFGGGWATAPDPLDFRDFYGVDFSPGSTDSVFKDREGNPRNYYVSDRTNPESSKKDFSVMQDEFDSDERRYARSNDISKSEVYDRNTGYLKKEVLMEWEKYDLYKLLSAQPKVYLDGLKKLKIIVGTKDNYFLDTPSRSFCSLSNNLNIHNNCLFVEGRNHIDLYSPHPLYPEALDIKIYQEMHQMLVKESKHRNL